MSQLAARHPLKRGARKAAIVLGDSWLDIIDAARRQGCSAKTIREHMRTGALRSVLERRPGRSGRMVVKWMIPVEDLDAVLPVRDVAAHIEELVEMAPPLSESQSARLWAILRNAPRTDRS